MYRIKIIFLLITLTLISCGCSNQSTLILREIPNIEECRDELLTNNFIAVDKTDSSTNVINIDQTICAIFDENYLIQLTPEYNHKSKRFTPAKTLIDSIEVNIRQQYWESDIRFCRDQIWERGKEIYGDYDKMSESDKLELFINFVASANWENSRYKRLDRQCAGFINIRNQRILIIQFYDFCTDPYNLKEVIKHNWVNGTAGWFGTNVRLLEYNIDTNRLNSLGWGSL